MKIKTVFLLSLFLLAVATASQAQDNVCESAYMPFKEGLSYELTNYNKKGKVLSASRNKVTSLTSTGDGLKAVVETETLDKNGKSLTHGSFGMECRGGTIYLDMSSMLDPQATAGFSSMEAELTGDALQIPNDLSAGQTLPDGTMEMKVSTGGVKMMSIRLAITNRKVEAEETITTPAGSFDCIKMSQETEMKILIKKKYKTVNWYAKGVGMVRSENYNSKGKLESYTELTKFEN
ncbi:MAG: hypothetical protein ACE5FF_06970 [Saprospiraceae bacterium]